MAALGADMTASEIQYDLATLTKSCRTGITVTMIHMTERPAFNSVKTKVEKSVVAISSDLSSALDQVAVLGQLGGHGHVHKLVCNAHLKKV